MVRQLVALERQPRIERLDTRTREANTNISALGSLKSAMTKVTDALKGLSTERELSARTATVTGQPEDNPYFTVDASSTAARSNYNIQVEQLAAGTRAQSAGVTDPSNYTTGGIMTFAAGDQTFDVEIAAGASLSDIASSVNQAAENFGVSASVINTGGATPETRLVFDSSTTGAANELTISADSADLNGLTTAVGLEVTRNAADARIDIDGIKAFSATNTFDNAIEGLTLSVERLTPAGETPRVNVDIDREGVRENVDEFMKAYNSMIDEVDKLTAYRPEGKSGPLIGDSMVRSIRSQMSSIISNPVAGADEGLNSLFQMGITTNNDGKLEFDPRNIGGGTGEQRFEQALDNNFDGLTRLFTGENGVATRLQDTIDQYTRSSGLIDGRENVFETQKSMVDNEREQFERYMESFESNLRQRFGALDQNIARMQSSSSFLFQRLGQM
jgi:flagellar hook-associated protein 2